MHLPPVAAVLRVSQLTMSPASSLWKVLGKIVSYESNHGLRETHNGLGRVAMMIGCQLGAVVRNNVNFRSCQHYPHDEFDFLHC